jgi:hypothetical protein
MVMFSRETDDAAQAGLCPVMRARLGRLPRFAPAEPCQLRQLAAGRYGIHPMRRAPSYGEHRSCEIEICDDQEG